jgi:quercetin dioxygenase-like cupin family protein
MPFIDFNKRTNVKIWNGITGTLAHSEQLTFGHFTLEQGTELPEHSHHHEQWSHVIEGELQFTVGGETMLLTAGMSAFIPSHMPHSAKAITVCRVIDCFTPVREDFVALEKS